MTDSDTFEAGTTPTGMELIPKTTFTRGLSSSRRLVHLLLRFDPANQFSSRVVELDDTTIRKPHGPHIAALELIPHEIAILQKDRAGDGFRLGCPHLSENGCGKLGNGVRLHNLVDACWSSAITPNPTRIIDPRGVHLI